MVSCEKIIIFLFLLLKITVCTVGQKKYANMYFMKNHILGLSEELKVDGIEEDKYFMGGKDVKHWLKLPSISMLYLIGIKDTGLSLITIMKKLSNPFYQAVEKQIDIGENITSTIAFKSFNTQLKKFEDIVVISTASVKNELILYKIQNYKLVQFWTWKRYAKVQSLLHFTVMREDRLLVFDSDGVTGYLYKFSIDNNSVHIRELEVIKFSEKAVKISISITFPEPYLYVIQNGNLAIYRYTRFCPDSWIGEFIKQISHENFGFTDVMPFESNGREYLAVSGKLGGILRVDATETIVQEVKIENVIEWLIIHTGPEKDNTILFCKTVESKIHIFYNTGLGWKSQVNPSCYKYDKEHKRITTDLDIGCLKEKKWLGAVSLELGQLPTLVFAQRKFMGEMYHIMVILKRHILSMEELPEQDTDYWNYLSKMRSNLKNLVGVMNTEKQIGSTCNIFTMLTEIENIATYAKEKVSSSCHIQQTVSDKRFGSLNDVNKDEIDKEVIVDKFENSSRKQDVKEIGINIQSINADVFYANMHPISPDMKIKSSPLQDFAQTMSITGFPKKQDGII